MSITATKPEPTPEEIQASIAKYLKDGGISAVTPDQQATCAAKCSEAIGQEQGTARSI